jgi:hypothetical protein
VASDRHYLVQSAEDEAGTRFVRASRWLGSWREETEAEALAKLVPRYLAAYGPATFREVLRWWGAATVVTMKPIFAALGDALTEVEVDGTRALVRTEDLDSIESTRPPKGSVQLVGGFDPLVVGGGLRDQLLPPKHLKRVSRTAGWISPVVLVEGRAAGVWDSKRTAAGLAITIDPFDLVRPAERTAMAAAAEAIGAAQGVSVTISFGRVFAGKAGQLRITAGDA